MEKMISKNGNVGYRYDEGERLDFDAFIYRLSQFGPSKQYWYDTIFEARDVTDNFDYNKYDKERVERLGYPADWLRRCGLVPRIFGMLPDENIKELCDCIISFDMMAAGIPIVFDDKIEPENFPFDSSGLDYENAPLRVDTSVQAKE